MQKINQRLEWGVKSFSESSAKAKDQLGQISELRHGKLVSMVYQLQHELDAQEQEKRDKNRQVEAARKEVDNLKKYILTAL